jgi:hypothetical protein
VKYMESTRTIVAQYLMPSLLGQVRSQRTPSLSIDTPRSWAVRWGIGRGDSRGAPGPNPPQPLAMYLCDWDTQEIMQQ